MPGVARGFSLLKLAGSSRLRLAGSSSLLGWSGSLKFLWQLRPPRQITIISVRVLMMMFFSVELIRLAFSASIVCFYRGTFGNTELKWCFEWSSWLYKIIFLFLDITKQSRSFTLENQNEMSYKEQSNTLYVFRQYLLKRTIFKFPRIY